MNRPFNLPITGYIGETRDQRLNEFLLLNPGVPVIGLPEGTTLQLENNKLLFTGITPGVLFTTDDSSGLTQHREITAGEDISFLL